MEAQKVKINLIPGQVSPIVHASQYDINRPITLEVYNGSSPYEFNASDVVVITGHKPDATVFAYNATFSKNLVSFKTTLQMLIVAGNVECELRVFDSNGGDIGTANFTFKVEKGPIDDNAKYSKTDIPAIVEAVHNIGIASMSASQALGYKNDAEKAANSASVNATNAATSAGKAATSEKNAADSAKAAATSEKNAFSGTPDGYAKLASTFNALGLYVDSDGYICQALAGEEQD